jgi:serine/threonine protein phosphatase PrpC
MPAGLTNLVSWRSAALTRVGPQRRVNEDAVLDRPDLGLWAVADGVGGHAAGDVASRLVLDMLEAAVAEARPGSLATAGSIAETAVARANAALLEKTAVLGTRSLIATTLAALLVSDGRALCLWAGDSRVYLLREDHLYQLTRDHTLAEEQAARGQPPADGRAAHTLTRAVGAEAGVALEWRALELRPRDVFLLCTDGVSHVLDPVTIADAVEGDPDLTVQALMGLALSAGARDDLSVIAARAAVA